MRKFLRVMLLVCLAGLSSAQQEVLGQCYDPKRYANAGHRWVLFVRGDYEQTLKAYVNYHGAICFHDVFPKAETNPANGALGFRIWYKPTHGGFWWWHQVWFRWNPMTCRYEAFETWDNGVGYVSFPLATLTPVPKTQAELAGFD